MYRFFYLLLFVSIGFGCAQKGAETSDDTPADVVTGQERSEVHLGYGTVSQVVSDRETLQRLSDALRATKLDEELAEGGPYTLFAPTDDAFASMATPEGNNETDSAVIDKLRNTLLHHVVEGKYSAADLVEMNELPTLGESPLKVGKVSDNITVDQADVILSDQEADNGYVHLIDSVLVPS